MLSPEIKVEIGSLGQQSLIEQEIDKFCEIIDNVFKSWFDIVIVAADFEEKIKILTRSNYQQIRGKIGAQAKYIRSDGKNILVISSMMFTEPFDTNVRYHFYFHETNHYINSANNPSVDVLSISDRMYMEYISIYYDEYCAERFAHVLCREMFVEKTQRYINFLKWCYNGHYEILSEFTRERIKIKTLQNDFRFHVNADRFLQNVRAIIEAPLLSFFYLLAFQKERYNEVEKEYKEYSFPFNQPASKEIAEMCHMRFPEPLETENAIGIVEKFLMQFGFRLETIDRDKVFVWIVD